MFIGYNRHYRRVRQRQLMFADPRYIAIIIPDIYVGSQLFR